jgi:hypothetical protein
VLRRQGDGVWLDPRQWVQDSTSLVEIGLRSGTLSLNSDFTTTQPGDLGDSHLTYLISNSPFVKWEFSQVTCLSTVYSGCVYTETVYRSS